MTHNATARYRGYASSGGIWAEGKLRKSFTCIVPLVRCMMIALGVRIHRLICGMEEEDAVLTRPCLEPLAPSPPSVRFSSIYCKEGKCEVGNRKI